MPWKQQTASDTTADGRAPGAARRPFALWTSLSLAFYLLWVYTELALTELPEHYAHTPWICLPAMAGICLCLGLGIRRIHSLSQRSMAVVCLVACAANALSTLAPHVQVELAGASLACLACGFACLFWARHLVTAGKEQIIPTVALAGLACSLLSLPQALDPHLVAVTLVAAPLGCAVCIRLQPLDEFDRSRLPQQDKTHTAWPLPCATLACTVLVSVFVSLLSDPFASADGNEQLADALVSSVFCAALLGWSALAQRRNLNGFLVAVVSILEVALLAYASGTMSRMYIPVTAIASAGHVLSILVWILAAFLARSPRTHVSYMAVFGPFMLLGCGFLGRLVGFSLYYCIDIPYTLLQGVALVLLVSIAALFLLFFCIEVVVMRKGLETETALQVATVRDEAAERVGRAEQEAEAIRNVAEQRIKLAEAEAALKVLQAEREVEAVRTEAAEQVEEARMEVETVKSLTSRKLKQAEYLVADMQARGAKRTQISIREACDMLAAQHKLTAREAEAFFLLCDGLGRREIAHKWVVSENTVKYHLRNIYHKMGVHNSRDLISYVDQFRMDLDLSQLEDDA